MWHLRAEWHHDLEDEPVLLYSEVDESGYEVRKVDCYRDGRRDWATGTAATGVTRLGDAPIPSVAEIDAQDEFSARAISAAEFDVVWRRAVDETRD